MATTTRVALLELLSEAFDDWWSQLTTAAGSATTIVDSKLAQLSPDDDFYNDWWVRNVATGQVRLVTDYDAASTTITHVSMTAVGDAATYELHRINPETKHNAIARASVLVYPHLYLSLNDETLVVGNRLTNADGETYAASAFTGWTTNGGTWSQQTTTVRHSTNSFQGVASGAAAQLYQAVAVNINEITGKTFYFEAWVYATATSAARLRLSFDGGSTFTNHDYHSGNDQWEYQKFAVAVPSSATSIRAYFEVADGNTAYFDASWAGAGGLYRYTIPSAIINGPYEVLVQADELRPEGPYRPLRYNERPSDGRRLRLIGKGMLSQPSTDATTVEIGSPYTELFLAYASRWLYRAGLQRGTQAERAYLQERKADWDNDIAVLLRQRGMTMRGMAADLHPGAWHLEDDSSGRYLVLDRWRG